ncbi:hypothetical protein BDK92_4291 [Micromonospora pisi]|uniref:Uncharacterized protein n=1 Tax=Micromonospora pisi TaxID=589240 RepID=A0A495JLJ7_9ACTN|nr:hypothetical protein [Micromonospora pisi]RKR89930.1 hypothetical protein BDK92_4291 [Micromonospora pisi]
MTQMTAVELPAKSRLRVKAHGEVFTPRRMVDQMLDLVHDDLEDGPGFVDKTLIEPAAGDSNCLVALLQRKLQEIDRQYQRDRWAHESLFALASIYGIKSLEHNHQDAKDTMHEDFLHFCASRGFTCGPHIMVGDVGRATSGARIPFRPTWSHQSPADVFEGGVV